MHLVIDSSILVGEGFGKSAHLSALLSSSQATGHTVYVPTVALEEAVARYRRSLEDDLQKISTPVRRISGLLDRSVHDSIARIDPEAETLTFRQRLVDQLRNADAKILDYPSTPHKDLASRAISRRRPFDRKGSGYRDSLIWQSVLELAPNVGEDIVLVSSDKDFADDQNLLHGDLKEDLENLGFSASKVTLSDNLLDLVDKYVRPKLGAAPWDPEIQILTKRGINLQDALGMIVQDACLGEELEPRDLGFPHEYESPSLDLVESIFDLKVVSTRNLASNRLFVEMQATVNAVLSFTFISRTGT